MELLQRNPFTTIKANDLNDSEINEQWVDIKGSGFLDLFCPTNVMPQYILGGKGSGKTHLMRYFSYKSQLDRNEQSPIEGIINDGFFGVYFLASGLNGSRFESLPLPAEARNAIFEYSFELWFAGITLEALLDLLKIDSGLFQNETAFCKDLCGLFNKRFDDFDDLTNVDIIKSKIVELSNLVDLEVNNSFFKDKLDIEILTNRGALIFGIPQLMAKHSKVFEKTTFLYLVDELENISEDQQKYINTLVREKQLPVSFRVGARRHGIKTWGTLGSGENNRVDHEFAMINLDSVFIDNKHYEEFAVDLVINRLIGASLLHGELLPNDGSKESISIRKQYLVELFEESKLEDLILSATKKKDGYDQLIRSFKSRLDKIKSKINPNEISDNLKVDSNILLEKVAIHLFSQGWFKNQNKITQQGLVELSDDVKQLICSFQKGELEKDNPVENKISYYNNNYVASALRAVSQNNLDQYHGFDNLLIITKGFPRHILTVLRHAYRLEVFQGKAPFTNSEKVSLKSQKLALKQSSDWFHDDCVSEGELGTSVGIALDRLCEILRIEMYADKPVECSASGFTIDKNQLSKTSKSVLDWAELIRVIVPAETQRQEKNSQKLIEKYQINGLLCPKWGLSLAKRGAISFTPEDIESILNPDKGEEFKSFKNKFYGSRNAPFKLDENEKKEPQQESSQIGLDI
tara:strand:+ start:13924 stop:15996 length:2073 start_codon:yes stop_codon:yes gene_type:complete